MGPARTAHRQADSPHRVAVGRGLQQRTTDVSSRYGLLQRSLRCRSQARVRRSTYETRPAHYGVIRDSKKCRHWHHASRGFDPPRWSAQGPRSHHRYPGRSSEVRQSHPECSTSSLQRHHTRQTPITIRIEAAYHQYSVVVYLPPPAAEPGSTPSRVYS
jgi:hypothetical protein